MKKITIILVFILSSTKLWAQRDLFFEISPTEVKGMSQEEQRKYNIYTNNPFVSAISFIKLDTKALNENKVLINFKEIKTIAQQSNKEWHDAVGGNFSWFGRLSDETGIFFTVMNNQVASKFYLENKPCLIIPFRENIHLLITYNNNIDNGHCGTPQESTLPNEKYINNAQNKIPPQPTTLTALDDNNCTMRVLWVVTAEAEPEITMNLELAARMLQDESNLAYQQSEINYRMEIARVVRTNYVETTTNTTATAYGKTSSDYPLDLINLSTGAGALNNIPALRDLYAADVVVMVRSRATGVSTTGTLYGVAYGVPTGTAALNAANAFALISTEFMIGGRFTFAHEIGHIQGARHDDHDDNPAYARGYVFSTTAARNRTIMARGSGSNANRVQFFSNPNVSIEKIPVGIAGDRDNARRINETATQMLNHRATSTDLVLPAETYDNEILARHLASQTISTNNNAVVALAGSRVSMRAGTSVRLLPGFAANNGSFFHAYISNCSDVPATLISSAPIPTVENKKQDVTIESSTDALQVYPNPFTNKLTISYNNIGNDKVSIEVFSMAGVRVAVLQQPKTTTKGNYSIDWDAAHIPSGVYIIVLTTDAGKKIQKVVKL